MKSDYVDFLHPFFFERVRRVRPMVMNKTHWHSHYEVYYLVSGERKYFINTRIYELKPGDIVLVPKGTVHKTFPLSSDEHERIVINVIAEWVPPEVLCCFDQQHIRIPPSQKTRILDMFSKIERENEAIDEYSLSLIRKYLFELMVFLIRIQKDDRNKVDSAPLSDMETAAQYISSNFHSVITLEMMAEKFSMSKEYFSKRFKQVTGVGFNEYMGMVRVSHAAKLLLTTDLSITEVAYRCGFNDSNYFSTVFKKYQGQTPRKYKKNNQTYVLR